MKHEMVKEAVVIVREDKDSNKFLCAYYLPVDKDRENKDEVFREFLSRGLPDYMIPSYFVPMTHFPLTAARKIDRKALPEPDGFLAQRGTAFQAPQTELEEKIAQCWMKVLKKDKVGIHDNFFELGGNSLNILQLTNKLKQALGNNIPVVSLYRYLTISTFARYLKEEQGIAVPRGKKGQPIQPVESLQRSQTILKQTVKKTLGAQHARKK